MIIGVVRGRNIEYSEVEEGKRPRLLFRGTIPRLRLGSRRRTAN
jgi:hypothetical protein